MIDLDELEQLANAAPSGQWEVWTSNSWRRVYADQGREKVRVIEPCSHPMDSHPDLMFGPGVAAWLEGFTPDVARELIAEVRRLRAALSSPIAMEIKWSPIESSMMSGFSQIVAEDALTREFAKAKNVTVYYGEKRTYTSMAAFCAAHPKEDV